MVVEVVDVAGIGSPGQTLAGDGEVVLGPVGEGDAPGPVIDIGPAVHGDLLGAQELLGIAGSGKALAAQAPTGLSPPGPVSTVELLYVPHAPPPPFNGDGTKPVTSAVGPWHGNGAQTPATTDKWGFRRTCSITPVSCGNTPLRSLRRPADNARLCLTCAFTRQRSGDQDPHRPPRKSWSDCRPHSIWGCRAFSWPLARELETGAATLSSAQLVDRWAELVGHIRFGRSRTVSARTTPRAVKGLLTDRLGDRIQLVGDDNLSPIPPSSASPSPPASPRPR